MVLLAWYDRGEHVHVVCAIEEGRPVEEKEDDTFAIQNPNVWRKEIL
jgi:hypothetical protein